MSSPNWFEMPNKCAHLSAKPVNDFACRQTSTTIKMSMRLCDMSGACDSHLTELIFRANRPWVWHSSDDYVTVMCWWWWMVGDKILFAANFDFYFLVNEILYRSMHRWTVAVWLEPIVTTAWRELSIYTEIIAALGQLFVIIKSHIISFLPSDFAPWLEFSSWNASNIIKTTTKNSHNL